MRHLFLLLCNIWVLHWTLMNFTIPLRYGSMINFIMQKQNWDTEKHRIQIKIHWERKIFGQLQLALDHTQAYIWDLERLSLASSLLGKKMFCYERVMGSLISASDMSCSLKCQEHRNVSICTKESPRKKKKVISSSLLKEKQLHWDNFSYYFLIE